MNKPSLRAPILVALLAITLPYLIAAAFGGSETVFTGFLLNPADGASYLAKMQLGMRGEWRFTLPYTAETSPGGYLFLFYIFLGHVARWLALPPVAVFHLARVAGAVALLVVLAQAVEATFPGQWNRQRLAFWLLALGAGMGWLVVFAGVLPMDFWVAEVYPFLSMFSNPHFPLGLALLVWIALLMTGAPARTRNVALLAAGGLLAIILPFGMVVAVLFAGIVVAWEGLAERRWRLLPLICLGALGGPLLVYQYWATLTDPLLAGWNALNLTPSPDLGNLLVSLSPLLPLALAGGWSLLRSRTAAPVQRVWIAWVVVGLALAYAPLSLQRRFLLGLYIPLVFLAVTGADLLRGWLAARGARLARRVTGLVLALAFPSTVLILLITLVGAAARAPQLYLERDEADALAWIAASTPPDALILASPETGRWIPAWTGRRVLYGHPYETVNAQAEAAAVTAFFTEPGWSAAHARLVGERGIDYLFYGPREAALSGPVDRSGLELVFQAGGVWVYRIP